VHQEIKDGRTLALALLWPLALKGRTQLCHNAVTNISRISNTHPSSKEAKLVVDFNFMA